MLMVVLNERDSVLLGVSLNFFGVFESFLDVDIDVLFDNIGFFFVI